MSFPLFAISIEIAAAIAGFICVSAVAWFVLELFLKNKSTAEERLEHLRDPRGRGKDAKKNSVSDLLEKAAPTLAKPLQPKSEKEVNQLRQKLDEAGFRGEASMQAFMAVKIIAAIAGLLLGGATSLFTFGFTLNGLLWAVGGLCVGFFIPGLVLSFITMSRKQQIFLGLPDALDLMVVCVEAGLGLDQAMRKVSEEMKASHRVIADEFAICNFQLQMGKERKEVLNELGARNGVDDLRALASTIIQAEKFGSSVGRALRVQSDSMRTKRRQIAEEKAAKTAVQLLFPLVVFIFPGIFVVLVGPAAITIMQEMLSM